MRLLFAKLSLGKTKTYNGSKKCLAVASTGAGCEMRSLVWIWTKCKGSLKVPKTEPALPFCKEMFVLYFQSRKAKGMSRRSGSVT